MIKYVKLAISIIAFLILGAAIIEFNLADGTIKTSEFLAKLNNDEIKSIKSIYTNNYGKIYVTDKNDIKYSFIAGNGSLQNDLVKQALLKNNDIEVESIAEINPFSSLLMIIFSFAPILLGIGFFIYLSSKSSGAGILFSEEKKVAKKPNTRFDDVQGVDEAKNEMKEIVDFLKNPLKYHKIGAKIPKGCLLIGEPGTGKTLMAKAIAGEAHVPFFDASGSEFIELFVGMGAKRVRELFAKAKKNAPCIIFIDEIDSIAKSRSKSIGRSNDEADQTLNQILTEMDGFNENAGIIIIGATNRPDILDKALLRPGRFDRRITIDLPDLQGRQDILKVHLKKVKHDKSIDIKKISKITAGMSGADLMNIVNEAALMAARNNAKEINSNHIDEANDRVIMGLKRKSTIMTEQDKKITAYHEAGHAILTYLSDYQKIHKMTIIPRGMALGMVSHVKDNDDIHTSQDVMKDKIKIAMAGRAAEEIIFGDKNITAGASSDIEYATQLANNMTRIFGMSTKIGRIKYEDIRYISETKKQIIDNEITKIIEEAYKEAKSTLIKKKDMLEALTKELLKKETLLSSEITQILSSISK